MTKSTIDMFKNDVRYRDRIAHVETIPARKASYKKVDNLNPKIVDYLKLLQHLQLQVKHWLSICRLWKQ